MQADVGGKAGVEFFLAGAFAGDKKAAFIIVDFASVPVGELVGGGVVIIAPLHALGFVHLCQQQQLGQADLVGRVVEGDPLQPLAEALGRYAGELPQGQGDVFGIPLAVAGVGAGHRGQAGRADRAEILLALRVHQPKAEIFRRGRVHRAGKNIRFIGDRVFGGVIFVLQRGEHLRFGQQVPVAIIGEGHAQGVPHRIHDQQEHPRQRRGNPAPRVQAVDQENGIEAEDKEADPNA